MEDSPVDFSIAMWVSCDLLRMVFAKVTLIGRQTRTMFRMQVRLFQCPTEKIAR